MYTSDDELAKIDLVRERTGLSYKEAREVLWESQWNVVDALVLAEQRLKCRQNSWEVRGHEVLDRMKELLHQGNITKIRVKHKGEVLFEIPVTVGVVGTVIAPNLALLAAGVCLLTKCTIEVERARENHDEKSVGKV